jgi:hypothetical protein
MKRLNLAGKQLKLRFSEKERDNVEKVKDWSFSINDYAVLNEKAIQFLPCHIGRLVQIFELKPKGVNDYTVKLENGDYVFVKEEELNKVDIEVAKIYKDVLEGRYKAKYIPTYETVTILAFDLLHNQVEVSYDDTSMQVVNASKLKRIENEGDSVGLLTSKYAYGDNLRIVSDNDLHGAIGEVKDITMYNEKFEYKLEIAGQKHPLWFIEDELEKEQRNDGAIMVEKTGYFEEKGHKLGKLVDEKQAAYGDSISKASKLMKVYLEDYKTADGYLIPEELLDHILLQVRIIDKQNRIFSNPKADKMNESPYDDISGYGMLGGRMQSEVKL